MRILVDADACPVKEIIIRYAKLYNIETIFYFDTSHIYENDFVKVVTVSKGNDAVDMKLLSDCEMDDICITNDYGLASLLLTKTTKLVSFGGLIYSNQNIDFLLSTRYLASKMRKANRRVKGPKKRTVTDDTKFENSLKKILKTLNEINKGNS